MLSGKGYDAIITRRFFENITLETAAFSAVVFDALSKKDSLQVIMAILSMSDISFGELKENLKFDERTLRNTLDILIKNDLVIEKESKHKALGMVYEMNSMYHTCLCILLATMEMQRYSLKGISCCMGFGNYPIKCS